MSIKENLKKLENFTKFSKWVELFDRRDFDRIDVEQHLFKKEILEYKGNYENDLLEQYKIYVELMDRINERIQRSYYAFLTVNSAIVGGIGYFQIHNAYDSVFAYIPLAIISYLALMFCLAWSISIKTLRRLYEKRFKIIDLIEERLPLSLFNAELMLLEDENDSKSKAVYARMETITLSLFLFLYIISFGYHVKLITFNVIF